MKVIIDASNVAHYKKGEGQPKLDNIIKVADFLLNRGDDILIIADASLKHEIDEKRAYEELLKKDYIDEVPAGTNADHFILNIAEEEKAKVLSNDYFKEFKDEFKDLQSMRIPFHFEGKNVKLGSSAKPKRVKNILQNISTECLNSFEAKRFDTYTHKKGLKLSGIEIAKEAINRISETYETEGRLENFISKIPVFDKVMNMVDDIERNATYVIFVLVHPKDYKETIKTAGSVSITVGDRLKLEQNPLVAVRNDIFIKPGHFELNILYSEDVIDFSPFNIAISINDYDYEFVKKNSRNIASTVAGRIGSWKFPIVSVNKNMILENPGEFTIALEKGGKD